MITETQYKCLCNAISEALREVERCPNDSIQDIFNEKLKSWNTELRLNHRFELTHVSS